jgi:hypothetical protein
MKDGGPLAWTKGERTGLVIALCLFGYPDFRVESETPPRVAGLSTADFDTTGRNVSPGLPR